MTTISKDIRIPLPPIVAAESVLPPQWVLDLMAARGTDGTPASGDFRESVGAGCALLSACVPKAAALGALELQHAVCSIYGAIAQRLQTLHCPHAVRFWNFIPQIHARMGSRTGGILDRYMVFNAGRFAAYARWYGQHAGPRSATATGIGHTGEDLVVHCLASASPGIAIENPRQVPAYRYSARRGPLPPCFARASIALLNGERVLMVGGTSSVRGEASVHAGDVEAQVVETLINMAALARGKADLTQAEQRSTLSRYRTLRVYCVHNSDVSLVRRIVESWFTGLESVEYVRADICRRTLLVEIEGVAIA